MAEDFERDEQRQFGQDGFEIAANVQLGLQAGPIPPPLPNGADLHLVLRLEPPVAGNDAVSGDTAAPKAIRCELDQSAPTAGKWRVLKLPKAACQFLVRGIAVALHDAAIVREQLLEMLAASRVGVDDGRRIGSAPGPVIARRLTGSPSPSAGAI
jgi:hypothetical protein